MDAIGRKSVIAHDGTVLIHHDEGSGDLSPGVLTGLLMQIAVELGNAGMEREPVMGRVQGHNGMFEAGRIVHRGEVFLR